jgi:hypothetical protein
VHIVGSEVLKPTFTLVILSAYWTMKMEAICEIVLFNMHIVLVPDDDKEEQHCVIRMMIGRRKP